MTTVRDKSESDRRNWLSSAGPLACAAVGALYTILGAFPVAAIVALVYRFPYPLVGYISGIRAMMLAPISVAFMLLFGGLPILGMLGAIAGWTAHARYERRSYRNKHREINLFAAFIDVTAVMLLAVWDKIYGPW